MIKLFCNPAEVLSAINTRIEGIPRAFAATSNKFESGELVHSLTNLMSIVSGLFGAGIISVEDYESIERTVWQLGKTINDMYFVYLGFLTEPNATV